MNQMFFVISNARSGAHLLRGLLSEAFDVEDLGEVFTPSSVIDAQFQATKSFDLFLKTRADLTENIPFGFRRDVDRALEAFFNSAQMETSSAFTLADIKYGHLPCLTPVLSDFLAPPYLLEWLHQSQQPIVHLVRRNLLKQYASFIKSRKTYNWVDYGQGDVAESSVTIELDTGTLVAKLTEAYRQIQYVDGLLKTRPGALLIYYEDLLDEGRLSKSVADVLATVLGPYQRLPAPITRKMSPALPDYVSNYSDVVNTLKGTPFESMLE